MKRKFANKIVALAVTVLTISTIIPMETKANAAAVDGWNNEGSGWHYYENGSKKSGWFNVNGNWYVADDDGIMKTGWYCTNGEWYFLGDDGSMKTGWISDGNTWYYLENNGSMKTGWIESNGNWYYLDSDGTMKIGWLQDNGKWYYLLDSGVKAVNTTINGYRIDANGWWIRDVKLDQDYNEIVNAKNAIKRADIKYISSKSGDYNLVYDKVSDKISKEFGISEETYAVAFQNEDQVDKYYFIGRTSGNVYKTASNGLFAAYLIKDGKIVERFKGPYYSENAEENYLQYLGNGEFR